MRGDVRLVAVEIAAGEDAAVNARVQGLDATAQHLRAAGQRLDVDHRQASVAQHTRRAARRDELHAEGREALRKIDEVGLVGNGKQRTPHST